MTTWYIVLACCTPFISAIVGANAAYWVHTWRTARSLNISIRLLRKMQREDDYSPLKKE